jgi:RNA polymerase sigma-70 factor (ECF subfamily)
MTVTETPFADLTPERILRDYAPRVYSVARRMLSNDADAEDVTQDVLLQVLRKRHTFRGEAAFPTWLHRVTVNVALAFREQRARREDRRAPADLDRLEPEAAPGSGRHWAEPPEQQALGAEMRRLIEEAIARLPEPARDVYVLADVEGLPNADIALILGLGLAAVKSRLHRARLMMRAALAPHFEESA